jgi:hypothetical protein
VVGADAAGEKLICRREINRTCIARVRERERERTPFVKCRRHIVRAQLKNELSPSLQNNVGFLIFSAPRVRDSSAGYTSLDKITLGLREIIAQKLKNTLLRVANIWKATAQVLAKKVKKFNNYSLLNFW